MISTPDRADRPAWIVLGRTDDGVAAALLDADGRRADATRRSRHPAFAAWVARDRGRGRAALGVERRARLVRRRCSPPACGSRAATTCGSATRSCADRRSSPTPPPCVRRRSGMPRPPSRREAGAPALFDWDDGTAVDPRRTAAPDSTRRSTSSRGSATAIAASADPGRLRLLIAAESAGALIAEELRAAGLPWDAAAHDRDPHRDAGRAPAGGRPARRSSPRPPSGCARRSAIPGASLDSQPKLLRALHRVGRAGRVDEPMGARRAAASGHRAAARVQEALAAAVGERLDLARGVGAGRSVPARLRAGRRRDRPLGVVGRRRAAAAATAARGGARRSRLAARRRRRRAARAAGARGDGGRHGHSRMPRAGATCTRASSTAARSRRRQEAKIAILGAMYGATTGESGRLVPRLRRIYPRRDGPRRRRRPHRRGRRAGLDLARPHVTPAVRGLGARPSRARPRPRHPERTRPAHAAGPAIAAGSRATSSCRAPPPSGRSRGWPTCARVSPRCPRWRRRMPRSGPARSSGGVRTSRSSCTTRSSCTRPRRYADEAAQAVQDAAASAARLLFGDFPIDFPLDVRIAQTALKD